MPDNGSMKQIGEITIGVFEGNRLIVKSTIKDQAAVRDILHVAEETIIRTALEKVSEKSNIIPAATLPLGAKHN
jgi:hypothetical protein